jgi:energy-coupling factor transporter ATP-binding protein EcfA2
MGSNEAKQPKVQAMYETPEAQQLTRLLQEATRATPASGPETYVAPSGGDRAEANYHHFIFGQRGSGKSSLLRHLQHQMISAGRVGVWIDQEIYSNLSYPDVLVSVLHELMKSLVTTLDQRISSRAQPPRRLLPFGKRRPSTVEDLLLDELRSATTELEKLKFAPLNRRIEWKIVTEAEQNAKVSAGVRMELVSLQAEIGSEDHTSTTASETVDGTKEEYLERALTGYRDLIVRTSGTVGGGFVFVDDLYQIRRDDQPEVLGYLHRLVKDTGLWLKVGSIRYSTMTFKPGNPPRGMQRGHDAHEVPLDRGLRHPQVAQAFLEKILSRIGQKASIDIYELITENARKRLVIAAGGVARDYLRITAGAIDEACNRGVTDKDGSHRIIVDDINKAAGLLSPAKFDDLKADEPTEAAELADLVRRLTEFCRARKRAYFLIAADSVKLSDQVDKLQHLRFAHLLVESETVPDQGSQRFNVWLLDVAELSSQRATPGMDFLGWEEREKRRSRKLIFTGEEDASARVEGSGNGDSKKAQPASKRPEPKKPEPKRDDTLF